MHRAINNKSTFYSRAPSDPKIHSISWNILPLATSSSRDKSSLRSSQIPTSKLLSRTARDAQNKTKFCSRAQSLLTATSDFNTTADISMMAASILTNGRAATCVDRLVSSAHHNIVFPLSGHWYRRNGRGNIGRRCRSTLKLLLFSWDLNTVWLFGIGFLSGNKYRTILHYIVSRTQWLVGCFLFVWLPANLDYIIFV